MSAATLEAGTLPDHAGQTPRDLQTFHIAALEPGSAVELAVAQDLIAAFNRDSIVNVSLDGLCSPDVVGAAHAAQRAFFGEKLAFKMSCTTDLSFSGYVYSGEETTAGERDAAEIFTVCRDVPERDAKSSWPCHGPVPWPSGVFRDAMTRYAAAMRRVGDRLLPLIAIGLGQPRDFFDRLTKDSWGHMRVLKFCERTTVPLRGIGAHTDYGLLVLASQDHVGGLWCRPRDPNEVGSNWKSSTAGQYENSGGWLYVRPQPDVVTCFPGDFMQFITRNRLVSTPHKVKLATEDRYAIAYFHEPSFGAVVEIDQQRLHYGEHFTNMFLRCYPDKSCTKRILEQQLQALLPATITDTLKFEAGQTV